MENRNTLKVTPGCFEVNGNPIDCVAAFKCEGFAFGLARVTLTFDVPFEQCMIGSEPRPPAQEGGIDIPVSIGGKEISRYKIHAKREFKDI